MPGLEAFDLLMSCLNRGEKVRIRHGFCLSAVTFALVPFSTFRPPGDGSETGICHTYLPRTASGPLHSHCLTKSHRQAILASAQP